jgi:hypothetical protein
LSPSPHYNRNISSEMTTVGAVGPEMPPEKTFNCVEMACGEYGNQGEDFLAWLELKEAWDGADRRVDWARRHALAWRVWGL